MPLKIFRSELHLPWFDVNALAFIPSQDEEIKSQWALFTHGYTSHKGDCLNWANRLVDAGVPCMIFDQPGHYLGSFNEVASLEDFRLHSHKLFGEAFNRLNALMESHLGTGNYPSCSDLILGGHSLGAFNAIRALELPALQGISRLGIGVGIGLSQAQGTHIFETAFYQKTLETRKQLVSEALDSTPVFAWLKEEKSRMSVSGQRIHLITGEDDVVVGVGGLEAFQEILSKNGNDVTSEKPRKLPHHEPGSAAPHLYAFLKRHYGWT
jgi:pimeloyl-ACP methyl ester carboxylesterase